MDPGFTDDNATSRSRDSDNRAQTSHVIRTRNRADKSVSNASTSVIVRFPGIVRMISRKISVRSRARPSKFVTPTASWYA
ncbi:hypothetical protein N7495_004471 [Penicillium taxi]|uniref:uncharacterized protein n=1 Tax=Penicillium taxi TaxID=168475 RepID=UPI00254521C8|nr:uncharacterized protein N7495_004471 [Penicillium taxi]KAJ5899727.1 hypothetical protein N7495_004471 [Penicillium taxi]